jgi:uncharacterized membrane protein (UPF0127 family)
MAYRLPLNKALRRRGICAAVGTALVVFGLFASLRGCDEKANPDIQSVKLGGKWFHLEIVDDDRERLKGLGGRDHIDPTGGMLFVFPQAHESAFVMRDCPIDIDIIFLDPTGRVTAMHQMKKEEPRKADGSEGQVGDMTNLAYENRLAKYSSKYPMQFAIELKGGTLPTLKVKEGDKIELPLAELKKRAE